jgi:hypothetical protein
VIDTEAPDFCDVVKTASSFGNLVCEPNQVHVQTRFGNALQSKKDLYENFEDALNKAAEFLPGGLFNVQVVRMQTGTGPALPVYVDFGKFLETCKLFFSTLGTAEDVVVEPKKPRLEPIIDECSTLPEGVKIGIKPDKTGSTAVFLVDENA